MDNPAKLVTYGTQNKDKQSESTTQYVLDTTKLNDGEHHQAERR
jgi:hypothetical protein